MGLSLGFGLVKVIERLVGFLHSAKGTLHLTLRPGRWTTAVAAGRHVRPDPHAQAPHDGVEDAAFGDRSVVEIQRLRDALQGLASFVLGRHGVEQEARPLSTSSP